MISRKDRGNIDSKMKTKNGIYKYIHIYQRYIILRVERNEKKRNFTVMGI